MAAEKKWFIRKKKNIRQEGRVALSDFFWPQSHPDGWKDRHIFCLGLFENMVHTLPEDASVLVREARSYIFGGYHNHEYPHILAIQPEPLVAILRAITEEKGIEGENDLSGQYTRVTVGKVSHDHQWGILSSVDSRDIWPGLDPHIINWKNMHYAERILSVDAYKNLVSRDPHVFIKALCLKMTLDK